MNKVYLVLDSRGQVVAVYRDPVKAGDAVRNSQQLWEDCGYHVEERELED